MDPVASTAYAWYVLAMLICCYGIYNVDKSVISVVLHPLKEEFLLSDTQLGLLTGLASTMPFALACIPLGFLADRANRKFLLVALIAIWSLMTGIAGFAQSATILFFSRIGVGAAEGGFPPISLSIISDYFPRRMRATALGAFGLGAPLGILMGMGIGGYVVSAWGWRAAFWIAGIPGLIFALLVGLTIREPVRVVDDSVPPDAVRPNLVALLRFIWTERPLRHIMIGMLLCLTPIAGLAVWLPTFFIRVHHLDIHAAGPLSALVFGVFGSSGAAICSVLTDRVGAKEEERKLLVPIIGSTLGVVCGVAGTLIAPSPLWALAALGPCAFLAQSIIGAGYSLVATLAAPRQRTATLAVLLVAINVFSYGLGSQLVGLISDHVIQRHPTRSLAIGIASMFVFSLWGVVHLWIAMTELRRRKPSESALNTKNDASTILHSRLSSKQNEALH